MIENYNEERKELDADETYVKVPRGLRNDLQNGLLTLDEYNIILWLMLNANCYNGIAVTCYEALVNEMSIKGAEPKNKVNKIMLSLKKKCYIWYPPQQGKKSRFQVVINGYHLALGGQKDISVLFEQEESISMEKDKHVRRKKFAELMKNGELTTRDSVWQKQKLEDENDVDKAEDNELEVVGIKRSANNDNDNDKNRNKDKETSTSAIIGTVKKVDYDSGFIDRASDSVKYYKPKNEDERTCLMVAKWLGEQGMSFILSRLRKLDYNTDKIVEAFEETRKMVVEDPLSYHPGRYFNTVLEKKMQEAKLKH